MLNKKIKTKQIVFVSTHFLKPRIIKMAYALSEKGYEVILFYNKVVNSKFKLEEYPYFKMAYGYGYHTQWLCLLRMMTFSPLVFHVFAEECYNEFPHMIIKMRKFLGKVVYDEYDMTVDRVVSANNRQIADEKYCIENADGVCSRSYELEYLKEKKKYFVKKEIQFFDYCWNNIDIIQDEIKQGFIYAGGVYGDKAYYGFCYDEIAKALNKKNLLFHMYPGGTAEKTREFLLEMEKNIATFKLMEPISHMELLKIASHYLAGVVLYEKGYGNEKIVDNEKENISWNIISYNYAVTNKFFDCIDAGLPIISNACKKLLDFLSQYGIVYYTNSDELGEDLDDILDKIPEMRRNVIKCREEFDIKKQIGRLIDFYQDL